MIIDAYAHCGISKYLPLPDVLAVMEKADVQRTVLCQHLGEYDNRYLAGVVTQHRDRFAAVCLVDLEQPNAIDVLLPGNTPGWRVAEANPVYAWKRSTWA
jgi:hypothetical protein